MMQMMSQMMHHLCKSSQLFEQFTLFFFRISTQKALRATLLRGCFLVNFFTKFSSPKMKSKMIGKMIIRQNDRFSKTLTKKLKSTKNDRSFQWIRTVVQSVEQLKYFANPLPRRSIPQSKVALSLKYSVIRMQLNESFSLVYRLLDNT